MAWFHLTVFLPGMTQNIHFAQFNARGAPQRPATVSLDLFSYFSGRPHSVATMHPTKSALSHRDKQRAGGRVPVSERVIFLSVSGL